MQTVESGGSSSPGPSSRGYRSRRSRPCDRCRKGKQLCLITAHGKPCGGCVARKTHCTFDLPPLRRHPKSASNIRGTRPPESTLDMGVTEPTYDGFPASRDPVGSAPSTFRSLPMAEPWEVGLQPSTLTQETTGFLRQRSDTVMTEVFPSWPGSQTLSTDSTSRDTIWQALFRPLDPEGNSTRDQNTVSLDLESADDVESHFLGTGTFRGLTLREINNATANVPNRPGMVQFRQVSADERNPVYFVRHPSLQYGQAPENGKAAWDRITGLCSHLGNGTLGQALSIMRTTLLHALPVINYPQFEQACKRAEGAGPVPYALLAATMAHAASYMSSLRPMHQSLWAHVLNALDAEFRQPRLQTLQLSMLLLSSRPGVNFAQSDITLSRTIGAVHVLGLHLDPSRWSLPRWERSLRARLFWTVLYHDKMRALLLGRPSHLHEDNYSTCIPTVEDARWVEDGDPMILTVDHRASLEAFTANCRLVLIIDKLLQSFMTVKSASGPPAYLSRLSMSDSIRVELDELGGSLPWTIRRSAASGQGDPLPTGIRSFQLTLLGIKVILHRIELDMLDRSCSSHIFSTVLQTAFNAASEVVMHVLELTIKDRAMFWMPYSFHHMSNAGSLLLRIATESRQLDPTLSNKAIYTSKLYCEALATHWRDEQWDMADETLKRLAEPAFTVGKDCPGVREIYLIISGALGYQVAETAWDDLDVTNHFGFINDGFDPSVWTVDGVPWFSM